MKPIVYKLIALLFCLPLTLFAKTEKLSLGVITGSNLSSTTSFIHQSTVIPGSAGNPFFTKARVDVQFGFFEMNNVFLSSCFKYQLSFNYFTIDVLGNSSSVQSETLVIDYNPNSGTNYTHTATLPIHDAYSIQVNGIQITPISYAGCTSLTTVNYDLIYLDCIVSTEYFYDFPGQLNLNPTAIVTSLSPDCSDNLIVKVPALTEAEAYELEYIWVYDNQGTLNANNSLYDFATQATRVVSTYIGFEIPLLYDEGFLLFRYRYIGRKNSNSFDDLAESQWSVDHGDVDGIVSAFPGSYYWIQSPFPDGVERNYHFVQNFLGTEISKKAISYQDGLGRVRQSLISINDPSNAPYKSIFQTQEFDYAGRVAVEFMPSPSTEDCYRLQNGVNFIANTTQHFDKSVFDIEDPVDPCIFNPIALKSDNLISSGPLLYKHKDAANYYSPESQHVLANVFVPNGFGYTYRQIQYRQDPFNTPKMTGSVGKTFQLGSGHESKAFIGNVSQQELDNLFHGESAEPWFYKKVVNVDPNGQTSFSIIDYEGRTVATGLNGLAPAGMDNVSDPAPISTNTNISLIPSYNSVNHNNFSTTVSYDQVVTEANTSITLNYDFTGAIFDTSCTNEELDCQPCSSLKNLCFTCLYEMEISVTDPCGDPVFQSAPTLLGIPELLVTSNPVPQSCQVGFSYTPINSFFNAPIIGEYHVSKVLRVSDFPIEDYWDQYLQTSCCILPECHFIDAALADLDISSCLNSCEDCQNTLYRISLPLSDPNSLANIPSQLITEIGSHCAAVCSTIVSTSTPSTCAIEREILRADFYPGGQYATYEFNSGVYSVSDPLSIFNPSCVLHGFNYNVFWTSPDANNPSLNALNWTLQQKVQLFNYEWTNSLVPKHPEFRYLEFCESVIPAGSYSYDQAMASIETLDEALVNGFFQPISSLSPPSVGCPVGATCLTNYDPLFPNNAILSNFFSAYLNQPFNVFGDMYSLALQDVEGQGTSISFGSDVNCNRDRHWRAFRDRYLNAKKWLLNDLRTRYAMENGELNHAIGSGPTVLFQEYNPLLPLYTFPFHPTNPIPLALGCYDNNIPPSINFLDVTPQNCPSYR
jgi:hypothetical protein